MPTDKSESNFSSTTFEGPPLQDHLCRTTFVGPPLQDQLCKFDHFYTTTLFGIYKRKCAAQSITNFKTKTLNQMGDNKGYRHQSMYKH